MADFEKDEDLDLLDDDESIVVMKDEEGNEYYYREERIIPIGDKRYAILIPIEMDEEGDCESCCDCGCEEETDVYIARIDVGADGEEEYVDPTDEEFEEVREAFEKILEEEEEIEA